ncbi:hypothetical protein ACLOJK_001044 [Asimina triloba]
MAALVDMYAKCGAIDDARHLFDTMPKRDLVTWTVMISAHADCGNANESLVLFERMMAEGTVPDKVAMVTVAYACAKLGVMHRAKLVHGHAGLVDEGLRFFYSMKEDYSVIPDVKHYTCIVDLLGRAGRLDAALELVDGMPVEKDEGWEDVVKVRDMMTSKGLKKTPGWTWIEINNRTHQFGVGDRTHPQAKDIYKMLESLGKKLEMAGYVPDTNFVLHDVDEELKVGILYTHSEKLAIAFGLISTPKGMIIRITKNLRVCGDCHTFSKFVSKIVQREIIVRDANSPPVSSAKKIVRKKVIVLLKAHRFI